MRILSASPRAGKTETDSQKGPGSSKRVFSHFWIQTLKGNRPKNDPRENSENKPNEYWIPTKRLKVRFRYETAAKINKSGAKANAGITENTILVESSLKCRLLTAVLCTNVHSYRCLAHSVFEKCYEILKILTKNTTKKPKGAQNGPDTENATEPQ